MWTAVIVAQVAVTVAFPAMIFFERTEMTRVRTFDVGFRSEQYLSVRLDADIASARTPEDTAAQLVHVGAAFEALRQRVAAEPGVSGVTFVDHLPRDYHPGALVELESASRSLEKRHVVSLTHSSLGAITSISESAAIRRFGTRGAESSAPRAISASTFATKSPPITARSNRPAPIRATESPTASSPRWTQS